MLSIVSPSKAFELITKKCTKRVHDFSVLHISQSLGCVLAENVVSKIDIPGFDRSMIDGYAVRACDTFGASESMPSMLRLAGSVRMGESPVFELAPGECAFIPTGGQLPKGADSAVMQEYCQAPDSQTVIIEKPVAPGDHLIFRGDEVSSGLTLLESGTVINSGHIGAMASAGIPSVTVFRRPVVGIISTGDELVPAGSELSGAQMFDVNSDTLAACVREALGEPEVYGIIPDDADLLLAAAKEALIKCDMLIISGGSSVGLEDQTANIINRLGSPGVFLHGIAIKPGKPTIAGLVDDKPVFGLPGHPLSAFVVFKLFVAPLIRMMAGARKDERFPLRCALASDIASNHGREEIVMVKIEKREQRLIAHPLHAKSGMIGVLSSADGYIMVDRDAEGILENSEVDVYPI